LLLLEVAEVVVTAVVIFTTMVAVVAAPEVIDLLFLENHQVAALLLSLR
jgi:hypothetical protein